MGFDRNGNVSLSDNVTPRTPVSNFLAASTQAPGDLGQTTPGKGKFTQLLAAVSALTSAATIALDLTIGNIFSLIPASDITINSASVTAGQRIVFIITTSGTTSRTITFGTNFVSKGVLKTGTVSGRVIVVVFESDGTNLNEVSRDVPRGVSVVTPGATPAIDPTKGNIFTLTPGEDETISVAPALAVGDPFYLIVTTSGTTSRTLTFGTGFTKTAGTLATGTTNAKVFVLCFIPDGTGYTEVSRTGAM